MFDDYRPLSLYRQQQVAYKLKTESKTENTNVKYNILVCVCVYFTGNRQNNQHELVKQSHWRTVKMTGGDDIV